MSSAAVNTSPCFACHCTSASSFSSSSGTIASGQRYASTIITPRLGDGSAPAMCGRVYDILEDMQVEQRAVLEALKVVRDPDLQRDIVSLGFIKDLKIDGDRVAFTIELTTPACPVKDQMRDQARAAVMQIPGVAAVDVKMSARVREAVSTEGARQLPPSVKNVIA